MKLVIDGEVVEVSGGGGASEEVYSTEEIRIGTWIDGKPLYRKVIVSTCPAASGSKVCDIPQVWDVKYFNATITRENGILENFPIVVFSNMQNYGASLSIDQSHRLMIYGGNGILGEIENQLMTIVFKYTKTTDTATVD